MSRRVAVLLGRWRSYRLKNETALAVWVVVAWAFAAMAAKLGPGARRVMLPDPVGAIVEKEVRSLTRTPRFRLVFIPACRIDGTVC